jgi:medium-chain acyl-[acyl-carrier-protein] hydrolase
LRSRPNARARLFCFPYAGGGAAVFRRWVDELPTAIEVWAVYLPGRERRIADPPIDSVRVLAAEASGGIREYLDKPFALFGHSMGALVGFEVARRLRRDRLAMPLCLAVSGFGAPHIPSVRAATGHLPDAEFLAELHRLNGTPASVLEDAELVELVLPMLRADFRAVETYRFSEDTPLACPIFAYGGSNDAEAPPQELQEWKRHTSGAFRMRLFDGDHFYLHPLRAELMRVLAKDILDVCP